MTASSYHSISIQEVSITEFEVPRKQEIICHQDIEVAYNSPEVKGLRLRRPDLVYVVTPEEGAAFPLARKYACLPRLSLRQIARQSYMTLAPSLVLMDKTGSSARMAVSFSPKRHSPWRISRGDEDDLFLGIARSAGGYKGRRSCTEPFRPRNLSLRRKTNEEL
jgi:hypothetical protein